MFNSLNASNYEYSKTLYNAEFEHILSGIINCYYLIIRQKFNLNNNENELRNVLLLDYLKNNTIRKIVNLDKYLFDREVPEDINVGRTDIKIQTINTFIDTSAYYIIECKRLNSVNIEGSSGLNAKYVTEGLCRFTTGFYTSSYKTNGMIGFYVEEVDIDANVTCINNIMDNFSESNTVTPLCFKSLHPEFNYSYYSKHLCLSNEIVIYHLMFDVSKNIQA